MKERGEFDFEVTVNDASTTSRPEAEPLPAETVTDKKALKEGKNNANTEPS